MASTLLEIGELTRARPAMNAPAAVVAAWYERKATVLRHLAGGARSTSERDTYVAWADRARAHAMRLR